MAYKAVTMADIARKCGVSIAAVSYTLNGKPERIPMATRQKILQIANLYQYRLNPHAKALATGLSNDIYFFYLPTDFPLLQADTLAFAGKLSRFLISKGFHLVLLPEGEIASYDGADAIITYRIDRDSFSKLGNLNFAPVISVDCPIGDDLFYEIGNDFSFIREGKTYLSLDYPDGSLKESLLHKGVRFVSDYGDIPPKEELNGEVVCLSPSLHRYLRSLGYDSTYQPIDDLAKCEMVYRAIELSISHTSSDVHKFYV